MRIMLQRTRVMVSKKSCESCFYLTAPTHLKTYVKTYGIAYMIRSCVQLVLDTKSLAQTSSL